MWKHGTCSSCVSVLCSLAWELASAAANDSAVTGEISMGSGGGLSHRRTPLRAFSRLCSQAADQRKRMAGRHAKAKRNRHSNDETRGFAQGCFINSSLVKILVNPN